MLRDPHLPLAAATLLIADRTVAPECLRRPRQAVDVGPPLAWPRIDDGVQVSWVSAAGIVRQVLPCPHGRDDVPIGIDDDQPQIG